MFEALFQLIPRCMFEPVAVLGICGIIIFFYRHWKKDKAETCLLLCFLLFLVAWRLMMPINSDRYALFLLPPMIYFMTVALEEFALLFNRFLRWPYWNVLFLCAMFAACLGKSFHSTTEDRLMYNVIRVLKEDASKTPGMKKVIANRDIYYFLDGRFDVEMLHWKHPGYFKNPGFFTKMPDADYYLLKLSAKRIPSEQEQEQQDCDLLCDVTLKEKNASRFMLWKKREKNSALK